MRRQSRVISHAEPSARAPSSANASVDSAPAPRDASAEPPDGANGAAIISDASDVSDASDAGICEAPPNAVTFDDAGSGAGCKQQVVSGANDASPCPSFPSAFPSYYTLRCIGDTFGDLHPDPTLMCRVIAHPYPADVLDWCCPCSIRLHIH